MTLTAPCELHLASTMREPETGRNVGWLPHERRLAISHIAHIIRNDGKSFSIKGYRAAPPKSRPLTG